MRKYLPHFIVLGIFIIVSLAYFYPVLQGKSIFQSDIVQYVGMAKQQNDYRAQTGEETYWTDSTFGGMPTYQLGAKYPHNYIKKLDLALRFLPRPADYLFLYFACFYVLMLVLKIDYRIGLLAALGFGFSTYFIIILGVGHNAKAHAIAYMPLVLAAVFYLIKKPGLGGFLFLSLALALELNANHFQMTYYLAIPLLAVYLVWTYQKMKQKQVSDLLKGVGWSLGALFLALSLNATNLMATSEYARFSTRGSSGLTINPDGTEKEINTGLNKDYITEYSYGISESLNLLVPGLFGGSNSENIGKESELYDFLRKNNVPVSQAASFVENAPLYWGDQPIVAAPAYLGAVIVFLLLLGIALSKNPYKSGLLVAMTLALLLSWGKNFPLLTDLFIKNVPLYNKFRAVSSIQVVIELCAPLLAAWGLQEWLRNEQPPSLKKKTLLYAGAVSGGLVLLLLLFKNSLFEFEGVNDAYYASNFGYEFVEALQQDRIALFTSDALRTLAFLGLAFALLWFHYAGKCKAGQLIVGLLLLVSLDLMLVDRRYVNAESFVDNKQWENLYTPTPADNQILKDTSRYRVLDLSANPFNSARASYFHNSVGGYHAAKPRRMQDIFDFYIAQNKIEVLNMLNVKYIIQNGQDGQSIASLNPDANGAAWLVDKVEWVETENEEILALDSIQTQQTAVVHSTFKPLINVSLSVNDSLDSIVLTQHQPGELVYQSQTRQPALAVFSEAYYPEGWQAYVDEQPADYFRANYLLRSMVVPAGKHTIRFVFQPQVVQTGSRWALGGSIIWTILTILFFAKRYKNRLKN